MLKSKLQPGVPGPRSVLLAGLLYGCTCTHRHAPWTEGLPLPGSRQSAEGLRAPEGTLARGPTLLTSRFPSKLFTRPLTACLRLALRRWACGPSPSSSCALFFLASSFLCSLFFPLFAFVLVSVSFVSLVPASSGFPPLSVFTAVL